MLIRHVQYDGTTPLYTAVQNGHTEVVKMLLEKDADVNKARTIWQHRFTSQHKMAIKREVQNVIRKRC